MIIKLTANVERRIDLGIDAARIQVINNGQAPLFIKNNAVVSVNLPDAIAVDPNTMQEISWADNTCRYLHVITSADAEISVQVTSIFKSVFRGTLIPNQEVICDFREMAGEWTIQNFATMAPLYYTLDCPATVNGPQTKRINPQTGVTRAKATQTIHLISDSACDYQVEGEPV